MGSFFFFPSIEFPRNYSFLGNRNNNFSDEIRDRVRTLRKIFLDDPTIFLSNFYRELFSEYIFFQTVYPDFINYLVVTRYTCFKGIRNISFYPATGKYNLMEISRRGSWLQLFVFSRSGSRLRPFVRFSSVVIFPRRSYAFFTREYTLSKRFFKCEIVG